MSDDIPYTNYLFIIAGNVYKSCDVSRGHDYFKINKIIYLLTVIGANQVGVYPSKLWYRPQDFVSFKEKLVYDGKKTARACRDESSDGRIVHEVFVKITKNERLDKAAFHKLSKFLQANPQVTGLERFCSRTIFSDKRSRRARMTQEVLLSAEDLSMGEEEYSLNSLEAELARISRPSRNFAKVLAFASIVHV